MGGTSQANDPSTSQAGGKSGVRHDVALNHVMDSLYEASGGKITDKNGKELSEAEFKKQFLDDYKATLQTGHAA